MNKLISVLIVAALFCQIIALDPTPWPRADQPCLSQYGWFWDGQKCEQCYNKWCMCNVYNGCSSCQANYFMRQDSFGFWYCDSCNGGNRQNIQSCCPVYDVNNVIVDYHATRCYDNTDTQTYMLFGSYCAATSRCISYTDFGLCTQCAKGYFLNEQATCTACSLPNCAECSDINTCNSCIPNFYLAQYKGQSNSDAASTTSAASLCKQCAANCICQDGSTPGGNSCQDCLPNLKQMGFYYDSTQSKCLNCIANCWTCNDAVKCTKCQDGYALDNTQKCVACPSNCQSCSYDTTNSATSCSSGYCFNNYYEYKADPTKNIITCQQCTDANSFRCKGDKLTTFCMQDATSYQAPHNSAYYLVVGDNNVLNCIKNDNNCKTMNKAGKCDSCYQDLQWFRTSTSNVCKQCQIEKTNCLSCAANNQDGLDCIQCQVPIDKMNYVTEYTNYVLDQASKSCKACSVGCYNCQSESQCNQCQKSYSMNTNKACDKCQVINCQQCDGNLQSCRICFPGFRIWNNPSNDPAQTKCEACEANCLNCDSSRKICTLCAGGYYLVNSVCKIAKTNCVSQRDDGPCSICAYGYRMVGGWCFSCQSVGYINCPYFCTNLEYTRDGDLLTADYEKQRYPTTDLARLTVGLVVLIMVLFSILI